MEDARTTPDRPILTAVLVLTCVVLGIGLGVGLGAFGYWLGDLR